jgi:hypothetical protein
MEDFGVKAPGEKPGRFFWVKNEEGKREEVC